eukprot:768610-Hanusia_phi.AAC.6
MLRQNGFEDAGQGVFVSSSTIDPLLATQLGIPLAESKEEVRSSAGRASTRHAVAVGRGDSEVKVSYAEPSSQSLLAVGPGRLPGPDPARRVTENLTSEFPLSRGLLSFRLMTETKISWRWVTIETGVG